MQQSMLACSAVIRRSIDHPFKAPYYVGLSRRRLFHTITLYSLPSVREPTESRTLYV